MRFCKRAPVSSGDKLRHASRRGAMLTVQWGLEAHAPGADHAVRASATWDAKGHPAAPPIWEGTSMEACESCQPRPRSHRR